MCFESISPSNVPVTGVIARRALYSIQDGSAAFGGCSPSFAHFAVVPTLSVRRFDSVAVCVDVRLSKNNTDIAFFISRVQ